MQAWNFFLLYLRTGLLHKQSPWLWPDGALVYSDISSPMGTFVLCAFLICSEKWHTKIHLSWQQKGFHVFWLGVLHGPILSMPCRAAMLHCALPLCESICVSQMDGPFGKCFVSHNGNNTRAPLSRLRHGVFILGNRRMKESLRSVACIKSRMHVQLW